MVRRSIRMILCSTFGFSLMGCTTLVLCQTLRLDLPKNCLCIAPQRPACELAGRPEVAAIFLGRALAINRLPLGHFDTVQFQVEEVFRGSVGATTAVQVYTHHCSPFTIAHPFKEVKEYVVQAMKDASSY